MRDGSRGTRISWNSEEVGLGGVAFRFEAGGKISGPFACRPLLPLNITSTSKS